MKRKAYENCPTPSKLLELHFNDLQVKTPDRNTGLDNGAQTTKNTEEKNTEDLMQRDPILQKNLWARHRGKNPTDKTFDDLKKETKKDIHNRMREFGLIPDKKQNLNKTDCNS